MNYFRVYLLLFAFYLLCGFQLQAQDKVVYFDKFWETTNKKDSASYCREITKENQLYKVEEFYLPSKRIYSKGYSVDKKLKQKTGKFVYFHENGKTLKLENYDSEGKLSGESIGFYADSTIDFNVNYLKGNLHGTCKWYHSNGKLASQEEYSEGKVLKIAFWDKNGVGLPAQVGDEFVEPKFQNEFNSAERYLYSKIVFPEAARYLSAMGKNRVVLNFSIEADGSVSRVFVEVSADAIFDDEALRAALTMPKWKYPARIHNRISRVDNILIPIMFTLVSNPIELNK